MGEEILIFWSRPFRKKGGPLPIQFIWEAAGGGRSPRHGAIDSHSCLAPIGEATAKVLARLSSKARQACGVLPSAEDDRCWSLYLSVAGSCFLIFRLFFFPKSSPIWDGQVGRVPRTGAGARRGRPLARVTCRVPPREWPCVPHASLLALPRRHVNAHGLRVWLPGKS